MPPWYPQAFVVTYLAASVLCAEAAPACSCHVGPAQVEFFSSMDLPYHAISDAEYDELAAELGKVLRACGDWDKAKDMCVGWCWHVCETVLVIKVAYNTV
jgi:hypothetical protein